MRPILFCFIAAFCAGCSAESSNNASSTNGGTTGGATGGEGTTTGAGGTTGGGASTGSSSSGTTGGPTGACAPNQFVCPAGTPKAGQSYPGVPAPDCGPAVGQTLPNLQLLGGAVLNFSTTEVTDSLDESTWATSVSMLELYCSGFRYVFIDASTVWCDKSADQAHDLMWSRTGTTSDSMYQTWLNAGGTVLTVLEDGPVTYVPATLDDLHAWIVGFNLAYPVAIDTNRDLSAFLTAGGWPTNLIVDLSNMQVVENNIGYERSHYQDYCAILGITGIPCSF